MNYNTQLCNTAWGKNFWRKLRSVRVFGTKTVTAIFLERWKGVAIENLKRQFNTKLKSSLYAIYFFFNQFVFIFHIFPRIII